MLITIPNLAILAILATPGYVMLRPKRGRAEKRGLQWLDSQSEVSVCLLEDPVRVKVFGGEVFGPADDGVDLLRQLLGLLLQLLMLLHTQTQRLLFTMSKRK